MKGLATPNMQNRVVTKSGYNNDIIKTLNGMFPVAVEQTKGVRFSGDNLTQKGRAIWNYLNKNIQYKKDDPGKQVIQSPSRMILDTKAADCKSKALAAAAFMQNNGFKDVALRYASYNPIDQTPTHVYSVAKDEQGNEIIVDPVYKQYNREVPYKYKKDYKMEISVLSGIGQTKGSEQAMIVRRLSPSAFSPGGSSASDVRPTDASSAGRPRIVRTTGGGRGAWVKGARSADPVRQAQIILASGKIKPGSVAHNVLVNYIGRKTGTGRFMAYNPDQLNKYTSKLADAAQKLRSPFIRALIGSEQAMIQSGTFTGNVVVSESAAIAGIREDIGRFSLKKIVKKVTRQVKQAARDVIKNPGQAIKKGVKSALRDVKKIKIKDVLKGVKAVGLVVPRKAFLGLVALNVRGIATRMSKLSSDELKKIWVQKFGGSLPTLMNTIKTGQKKKPLFGASKKVKGIKGIGYVVDDGDGIGFTGVEIAGMIAAAAPIMVAVVAALKGKGIPEVVEAAGEAAQKLGESGNFPEADGMAQDQKPGVADYIKSALNIATATGIIPDRPLTPQQSLIDQAIPGDDHTEMMPGQTGGGGFLSTGSGTGFKLNPMILVGAAGVAALLLMRKK